MKRQELPILQNEIFHSEVDIIWNTTLICPWDCAICCVDAVHVTKHNNTVQIRSRSLTVTENFPTEDSTNVYDLAAIQRQKQGLELDLTGKLRVLDHLSGFKAKIDISGGDPLVVSDNFKLLREATRRFGRECVTLTATGAGLSVGRYDAEILAPLIGELNFTYDSVFAVGNENRPDGYARGNLRNAAKFAAKGVPTRAECPLTTENISDENLRTLYKNLHIAGIDKLLLMRLFPVGRGAFEPASIPSTEQYRHAIEVLREMESIFKTPALKLQCAMKEFDKPQDINPCDLVRESFGLMADGTLLASPWAVNEKGGPLHEVWVLGNLAQTHLRDILETKLVRDYGLRLDENFGQCKIQAFLNSKKIDPFDRIFDITDSLYVKSNLGIYEDQSNEPGLRNAA